MSEVEYRIYVDKPIVFIQSFLKEKKVSDIFLKIADCLLEREPSLVIRTDGNIIGLSCPGERYWCYASRKDDEWRIKFFHLAENFPICSRSAAEYRKICNECCDFYVENSSAFLIGIKKKSAEQPTIAHEKATERLDVQEKVDGQQLREEGPVNEEVRTLRVEPNGMRRGERTCDNCMNQERYGCGWSSTPCEEYRPKYIPSAEEIENRPTHGDATASDADHRRRYFRGRST